MRKLLFLVPAIFLLSACYSDKNTGLIVRPDQDAIGIFADTIHVESEDVFIEGFSASTDTLLLGEYYDPVFGPTKAEIVAQLAPPVGYVFPDSARNPTPDSLVLYMRYNTWFGLSNAPIEISIYELDTETQLNYSDFYYTDFNVDTFTTKTKLLGKKIVTSVDETISDSVRKLATYMPTIKYKCTEEQMKRFFNMPSDIYKSETDFLKEFKGLYITTNYGSSTMFNLAEIELKLFYHYTYNKFGKDTTVNTTIAYPANRDVRQLNKISHPDIENFIKANDSLNFIKSAAGTCTRIKLPVGEMRRRIVNKFGEDKDSTFFEGVDINGAILELETVSLKDKSAMNPPEVLMLVRENEMDSIINHNLAPSAYDKDAVLGFYNSTTGNYAFDLAYFLDKELSTERYDYVEKESVLLIPVNVIYNSSYAISSAKAESKLGGVAIRSGKNPTSGMKIRYIYSAF